MLVVAVANAGPVLQNIVACRACGDAISFLDVKPGRRRRPVDALPREHGEYLLLRNGKALDLRHPGVVDDDEAQSCPGKRYWDHMRVCRVPSMRTAKAALEGMLTHLENVAVHGKSPDVDPGKRLSPW